MSDQRDTSKGKNCFTRRTFLERFGAAGMGGAAMSQLLNQGSIAQNAFGQPDFASADALRNSVPWQPPPLLTNPNILIIMVDQMRFPTWLSSSQMTTLSQQFLPNISGAIQNNAYSFPQYYVAATVCTASRATLLTGLYAPQTAMYIGDSQGPSPDLSPAFPTWAATMAALNPAYQNNCWWFGKWHLSVCNSVNPLRVYGFNTRTYPGGASKNPSPDGFANEGTDGGTFHGRVFANDAQIAGDFIGWLQGQAPSAGPPSTPWCATVSLINPHDLSAAPAWLQPPYPPVGVPIPSVYFPPPAFPPPGGPSALYASLPSPWNYENLQKVTGKPSLQLAYQDSVNKKDGKVVDWVLFLNQYYWLQNYVDQQVGAVLTALANSGQAGNTVIIFTSDHGEYAGSHGLHGKGSAAYEESIHVPLYVKFPGQTGCVAMNQMCSSVDVYGLICDLATSGGGFWRQACPDLASRQPLWSFLYQNAPETRIAPVLGIPYIFHTCDTNETQTNKSHLVCLRTKADPGNATQPGAKLAIYSKWAFCTVIPDDTPPDYEFYDYNPLTAKNYRETGNDYLSTDQATQDTIAEYLQELGTWGPPATGLIGSELNAPLIGTGTDGLPLSQAQAAARQKYFDAISGPGACIAETT